MKMNFCSAPCGSGKTHQIVNRACKWAKTGRRVVILQPTKELIDKTVEDEIPRQDLIHQRTKCFTVALFLDQ